MLPEKCYLRCLGSHMLFQKLVFHWAVERYLALCSGREGTGESCGKPYTKSFIWLRRLKRWSECKPNLKDVIADSVASPGASEVFRM